MNLKFRISGTLQQPLGNFNTTHIDKPIVKELPTPIEIVKNVGKSLVKNAKELLTTGSINAEEVVVQERYTICQSCEWFRHIDNRCGKCGCYLAFKPYLKAEKCPVGKW